jgi:uncharacterized protein (DUF952 family)
MTKLYRIVPERSFRAMQATGVFVGSADDRRDGFIHLSAGGQVRATAAKHYAGQTDLMLLALASETLDALRPGALKWEISRGGDRFPHLYATLPVEAVLDVHALPLGDDGAHVFPELEPPGG